ncbi:MAG: hypothetical protein ABIP29_05675, partial [Candidatus Eisenbacteria bacterium]
SVVANVNNTDLGWDVFGSAFHFDAARGRILVHGGRVEHGHGPFVHGWLEAIDVASGEVHSPNLRGPERAGSRWGHAFAYDAKRDRLLLQGGWPGTWRRGASRETWALALDPAAPAWSRIGPWEGGPPWREGEASAYDPAGERVFTWGGAFDFPCLYQDCETRVYSDVWSFDVSSAGDRDWDLHRGPAYGLEGRVGPSLVLDPGRQRLVGFGGMGGARPPVTIHNDLATFPLGDPGNFTLIPAAGVAPPARRLHASVVDAKRGRMLVLDGSARVGFDSGPAAGPLRDAWSYDLAGAGGWTQLPLNPAAATPGPGLQAAIDPVADRVLAVSWPMPLTAPAVWELALDAPTAWSRLEVVPGDAPTSPGRVAWDPVRGRLLLFEFVPQGFSTPATMRAWALDRSPEPRWRRLEALNALAVPFLSASHVVYDAVHDRFVIAHPGAETQVWALEFGEPRWPITLSWAAHGNGRGNASAQRIVLHSASPAGSPIFPRPIDLSRIDPATWTWTGVEPHVDGQGRPGIEVEDVDGDGHADWIVHVRRRGGSVRGGEPVTFAAIDRDGVRLEGRLVQDAAAPHARLHGEAPAAADVFSVRPLVARGGGPRLSFAASSNEPVTATLHDVRGRRIATRAWTPAGGAPEIVAFEVGGRLAPGIYLARVRQGAREATVRLVTL